MQSAGFRVAVSATVGVLAALGAAFVLPWQATALTGWDVTGLVFLAWIWGSITRMAGTDMRALARREEPSRFLADMLLLGSSVGCLVGVGFAVAAAHDAHGGTKALLVGLTVLSVAVSWSVVHTVFALHYARIYYGDPEPDAGIAFTETDTPDFLDFAYVAFTVGMTYQVSDTELTSRAMRRAALGHALLSFVFGTFILAVTINAVAGLL